MPSNRALANCLRILSIDAVQQAQSGHPGMPMGMADIAEVLWNDFLKHNPKDPNWPNRDRFILSNGHGSMLHYALLHLTGYDLDMASIKAFRQLHSKTPGHPEYGITPGVETTTGPLGQGFANAVGMAIAEKRLAAEFNTPTHPLIDHHTYVFLGDGCLMEGISHEAASLAGTLGLGKLIAFWDDNGISIDGPVQGWFTEDVGKRFEAYGWHVIPNVDGHDRKALHQAITQAQQTQDQPTLICCKTVIGFGSPAFQGSAKTHGEPLGHDEIQQVRQHLGWTYPPFDIPQEYYQAWNATHQGHKQQQAWQTMVQDHQEKYPQKAADLQRRLVGALPKQWPQLRDSLCQKMHAKAESLATRKASQQCLEYWMAHLPELLGGSADLSGSNGTCTQQSQPLSKQHFKTGNYLHYGVREFAMFAIMNGLALHGGFLPYGGTFLVFIDYGRNAMRLAAMMQQRLIWVLTHDSIALGEDGPTHQPIEHTAMLRLTPNIDVWRPCDSVETAVAWSEAIERQGPTALLLTRQSLPHQQRNPTQCALIKKGAYVLWENNLPLSLIIMATGSEVQLALQAALQLDQKKIGVRVVSMPCLEQFARQENTYQESILPPHVQARMAIEAGVTHVWHPYVGSQGTIIGVDRFGESAPGQTVCAALGIHLPAVLDAAMILLKIP